MRPRPMQWDSGAWSRDHREDNPNRRGTCRAEMPGYEDLDAYGRWEVVRELRQRLGSREHGAGLGAIPHGTLGVGRSVGLDVGR